MMKQKSFFKHIGEYKRYEVCRFCYHSINPIINLNHVPLAGGFIKSERQFAKEKFFPLTIAFCRNCYLLQVTEVISRRTLFKNYFYHSSVIKTLVDHFKKTAKEFARQTDNPSKKFIVEIGCNDGKFIEEAIKQGFQTIGIDPARNIVIPQIKKGLPIINDYFTPKTAKTIINKYGRADIIFSSNTLAHIEDMHEVYNGINFLLKDNGILVFENHYLGNLIHQMQFDMIYHEHQYYYSIHALIHFLNRHNMEIFDIRFIPIHAGSIRIYVQKKNGGRKIKKIVYETLKKEKEDKLINQETFFNYNKKIMRVKKELLSLLHHLKKKNKRIAGYGASGRGTILMNYCGIGSNLLDYIIDDAPAKQGAYTPGTHLLIKPSSVLIEHDRPDYLLLFAWSFADEIIKKNSDYKKNGGKFIIPLPKVEII